MHTAVTTSRALTGTWGLIRELGVDPDEIARHVDINPEALRNVDFLVNAANVASFFELASVATNRPDFGMLLSSRRDLSPMGPVWLAMNTAVNVREELECLVEFSPLHTKSICFNLEPSPSGNLVLSYSLATNSSKNDRQAIELGFALICCEIRKSCGENWQPTSVQFCHAALADESCYHKMFGNSVFFNQDRNALFFNTETLKTPLASTSSELHRHQTQLLKRQIDADKLIAFDVENCIRSLLPFSSCNRKTIAKFLHLSERSLQRRLIDEGITFRDMLNEIRLDIAMKYLVQSKLPIHNIAEIVGFSASSAFTRSFKRQYGKSPREVRSQNASNYWLRP